MNSFGPDKFQNGLKKGCTDPLFVYTGPAGPRKVLSSKQYTAICDRICTVSYKRVTQVKKLARSKICRDSCKRGPNFILLHEKFLLFDWLRAVVFQLNLKYLLVRENYKSFAGSSINK